jgi:Tfp pilus assembly protein PilN
MIPSPVRLGLVLQADRIHVAILRSGQLETFVVEAEQPSAALRAELESRKIRPRTASVALPRSATTVKPVELPEIGEIDDMVRFELERHLTFPAEDAPFDFLPMPADPAMPPAPGRRVLVTAADRRVVDTAVRLVQDAGMRPTSVTVASHELLGLVAAPRGRRVAWVHRTGADAELLLLLGGELAMSRQIPDADDTAVATEIPRSLGIVRWRAVDEIWISGDATMAAGPTTSALAELGVPVVEPPYTARARKLLGGIEDDARGMRQLAAAVVSGRRTRSLDLIPGPLRVRRFTRPQIITAGVAAATVLLALAALIVPGYRDRNRLATLNTEINRLAPELRAVEGVQKELERKRTLLTAIDAVEATAILPLPILRELTELLPTDAWLTLLSLDSKGAELTGQAAAASSLIPLLENSARFERVEFASPVTRGRDKEQFRIVARWEGGSPRTARQGPATAGETAVPTAPAAAATATPPGAPGVPPTAGTPRVPATPGAALRPPFVPGGTTRTPLGAPGVPPGTTGAPGAPTVGHDPDTPGSSDPTVQPRRPTDVRR